VDIYVLIEDSLPVASLVDSFPVICALRFLLRGWEQCIAKWEAMGRAK